MNPASACVFYEESIHIEISVRTNIDIDDELMAQAMAATGMRTKKATVEAALRKVVLLATHRQALRDMKGLGWEGDLDEMRRSRFADEEPW